MITNNSKLTIFVSTHKPYSKIRDYKPYVPIQLGKALHPDLDLGYQCDNEGDNISHKNASWNELTGLYWVWKNFNQSEYVGFCHYRRYFDVELNDENIDKMMKGADILVARTHFGRMRSDNIYSLCISTSSEDAWIFVDTMLKMHPEYADGIKQALFDNHIFFPFNMFIMSRKLFNEYCEFIMPVLTEVEKIIKPHGYSRLDRTIGYMGEWSLGCFIISHKLKFKELPWLSTEYISHTKPPKKLSFRKELKRSIKYYFEINRKHKHISLEAPNDVLMGLQKDGITLNNIK